MNMAIVILCYNDDLVALRYLSTIMNYDLIDKIIVVDNCSNDDIYTNLVDGINKINENSKIDIIRNSQNLGYAKGNNIGIKYAMNKYNPRYIGVSNTDVEYDECVIENIIEFFNTNENAGIVAPLMLDARGNVSTPAWKMPNYGMVLWNASFLRQKIFNPQLYKKFDSNFTKVDVLPGSLFFAPSKVWEIVNGFDEDTFLYGEESLIAFKVLNSGFNNYLINDISFVHRHSEIINKNIKSVKRKFELLYEANQIYNRKCLKLCYFQLLVYKILFNLGRMEFELLLKLKSMIKNKD